MGGLEIDPQSRVLDKDQKPIVRALPHSKTNQVVADVFLIAFCSLDSLPLARLLVESTEPTDWEGRVCSAASSSDESPPTLPLPT